MEDALKLKENGNALFKEGDYIKAIDEYKKGVLELCKSKLPSENEEDLELSVQNLSKILDKVALNGKSDYNAESEVLLSLFLNLAACFLKINDYEKCIQFCDRALSLQADSSKALFRKSQALFKLERYAEAVQFCKSLVAMDPGNQEAQKLMIELKTRIDAKNSISNKAIEMLDAIAIEKSDSATMQENSNHLKQILGSVIDDPMLAKTLCLRDMCSKLWAIRVMHPFSVRILRKLIDYEDCKPFVLSVIEPKEIYNYAREYKSTGVSPFVGDELGSLLQIAIFLYQDKKLGLTTGDKFSAKFSSPLGEGEQDFDESCINLSLNALSSKDDQLRKYAMESLVRLIGTEKELSMKFVKNCNGLNVLLSMLDPKKIKGSSAEEKVSEDEDIQRLRILIQQIAILLGRVLPSLKNDDLIKDYGLTFTIPALTSDDIFEQMKGCAALVSVLIANLELGVALLTEGDQKIMPLLLNLAQTAPAKTQGLICEIFANMANSEAGRGFLKNDERFVVTLNVLVQSDSISVRTNAAVTLAKLNAAKFEKESDQGMIVLSSVFNLLKEKSTEEEKAKGVEAVSYVITDRDVKMMLCTTAKGVDLLKTLVKLAIDFKQTATSAYAYGLAYIFENLTMSEDDKRREKLREMEVTQEQWEQFQKITKTDSDSHKKDPQENVDKRIQSFIDCNGAAALRALVLNGGSERVRESVAKCYCNCAVLKNARGQMFSQGAPRALIDLTSEKTVDNELEASGSKFDERAKKTRISATKKLAAHALAKMFITTDPNLVGFNVVMDSLKSLVDNLRLSDEDLILFETCMALTNLSTVSEDAKRKIINLKAIQQLEYASYNEDLLVRRSACECLSNLVPEPEMMTWFCEGNHMKLWLMFAGAYEDDLKTSEACLGALAGAAFEKSVAEEVEKQEKGIATLVVILMSQIPSLIHRVIVIFLGLLENLEDGKTKLKHFKIENAISSAESIDLPQPIPQLLASLKESLN